MIKLNEKNNIKQTPFTNNLSKKQNFNGGNQLTGMAKAADIFIRSQENLSSTRFIQDTATNWAPKALFARSKADLAEISFLEFIESGIFYFASPFLGEKLFRNKIFNRFIPENIRQTVNQQIPNRIDEIIKNNELTQDIKKRAISQKAGIVLACTAIPVAEYTLSFAKNLFTLKQFNKSNFNNIANLDKNHGEKENINQQKRVEENSKKQLKKAVVISAASVAAGGALACFGHKSELLQKFSKTILEPGKAVNDGLNKIGIKSNTIKNTIGGISLDFANKNGKLALSKGQLGLTAIVGLFGYSKAAEDRGKLDVAEVWTRVPLVVFYTIFGAELFEKAFSKILEKKNKFPDIVSRNKDGKVVTPLRKELVSIANKIAAERKTDAQKELARLTKEKAFIQAVPYAFSLIFMGLTLSGITRLWTQYRYNKQKHQEFLIDNSQNKETDNKQPDIFKTFKI